MRNPIFAPTVIEDISSVNIDHIKPQYNSINKKMIRSIIERRGATLEQIFEDVVLYSGRDTNKKSMTVMLSQMKKNDMVWTEKLNCKCCYREVTYYYATDKAKQYVS